MKKLDFQRLMDDSRFMKVLSVGVAILFWFVVAFTISPTITTTVSDVPITISGSNETLSSVGLDVVDGQNRTVRVKVEGRREVVGSLKPSDVVVYPVLTSVTEAGKYTCSLRAVKADSAADFTILSVSPEQVELTFDRVKTLKTELSVAVSGYTAEEGYILGSSAANPKEITVKGPESAVDQVAKAEVRLDGKDTKLAKTAKVEAEVHLYAADGSEIELGSTLSVDTPKVQVTIPVLKKATLPLKVAFTNLPSGLDGSALQYDLSETAIQVAGPAETVDRMTAITLGYVNVLDFDYKNGYTFQVQDQLPTGFVNLDDFDSVAVSFGSRYDGGSFTVSNINVINAPENYDISVVTRRLYGVKFVGLHGDIDALEGTDIVAEVDGSSIELKNGQYNVPVQLSTTSGAMVWPTGSYEVVVKVSAK